MPSAAADPRDWWRDAVIYQVYIRSFADSDGDGIGDLNGIRSRLSYLAGLGVDAIWINPFYPSPMVDAGYDVADYRAIEPMFGTLEQAEALVPEAHAHGLRVVLDLVPNHTSDQHPWFRAALAAGPGSAERDRYVFRPGRGPDGALPPNDWTSVFGGPAWERVADGEWYLHLFAPEQPDLNWRSPAVVEEFHDILRFWLARGVDGFRIDVAHGLIKADGLPDLGVEHEEVLAPPDRIDHPHWDRDEVHEIYRGWRKVVDEFPGVRPGEKIFVAEAWVANPDRLARYVRAGELHTAFNFDFLRAPWEPAALREVIDSTRAALGSVGAPETWVLSNHDVTRHVTRYGGGEVGLRRARAAALLMLALPGGAYVYQGEELGLEEVEDLPESVLQDPTWERSGHAERGRDGCRVPIPWAVGAPAFGFGPDGPRATGASWLPQPEHWKARSVEAQDGVEGSTLELYRTALRLRHELPALGEGSMRWLSAPGEPVLAFTRAPGFACVVNLGPAPARLPVPGRVLLASGPLADDESLPPDTAAWVATG